MRELDGPARPSREPAPDPDRETRRFVPSAALLAAIRVPTPRIAFVEDTDPEVHLRPTPAYPFWVETVSRSSDPPRASEARPSLDPFAVERARRRRRAIAATALIALAIALLIFAATRASGPAPLPRMVW